MTDFSRIFSVPAGAALMARHCRPLPRSVFRGKRVAVVGPADSAYNSGKGRYIDSFDLVVRINKAALLIRDGQHQADIGSKIDVLFHSFYENDVSGGGKLDIELYQSLGVRYLAKPVPTVYGYRDIFNFYKKYLLPFPVYTVSYGSKSELVRSFGSFRPTNGFCALKFLLESDFSELFITGFTFFKTGYVSGYRDSMQRKEQANAYINQMKIHNPELEFAAFQRIYSENRHKNVLVDEALFQILKANEIAR